ncbi:MAG: CDC48 family AAA ATPase [Candidatus Odinarchaeia archaeon]
MELSLRVSEAYKEDIGRFIIRIHKKMLKHLEATIGDIVELKGRKKTAGIIYPLKKSDEPENIIRLDGLTRINLKVGIGETIIVRKIEEKSAKSISITPLFHIIDQNLALNLTKEKLLNYPICQGDVFSVRIGLNKEIKFKVTNTDPKGIVVIRNNTKIILTAEGEGEVSRIPYVTYEDIGGFKSSIKKVREIIELPLKYPDIFSKLGVDPPKGVLLYGPPGCGKTLLAQAVANESKAYFISINGPEIMSKFYGESEKRLREIFEEAEKNAPSIIFIDELDALAPKREETRGEVERRVVAQLLTLMDGIKSRGKIIIIGATNRINAIDPALRRPGRFDREIELNVPNLEERLEILKIHTRGMPLDESVNLRKIAELTNGFVGADLAALCREAGMRVLQKVFNKISLEKAYSIRRIFKKIVVKQSDFLAALKEINPSALREIHVEKPKIRWENIAGLQELKNKILSAVKLTLNQPNVFDNSNVRPYRGILLYGPPGVGKTMILRGLSNEVDANFIEVKGSDLISKWIGETEKAIEELFRKAKIAAPCLVFIDEIDAIGHVRMPDNTSINKIVSKLISEIDKLDSHYNILLLAATNRPDILDPALLRPGRFDLLFNIPPPNFKDRIEIIKKYTKDIKLHQKVNLEDIASLTNGFVGSDIHSLCREALVISLQENSKGLVKKEHFIKALENITPTLSKVALDWYKKFESRISRLKSFEDSHVT